MDKGGSLGVSLVPYEKRTESRMRLYFGSESRHEEHRGNNDGDDSGDKR